VPNLKAEVEIEELDEYLELQIEQMEFRHELQTIGLVPGTLVLDLQPASDLWVKSLSQLVGSDGKLVIASPNEGSMVAKYRNTSTLKTPLEKLSLDERIFDFSLARLVFSHLREPGKVLEEMVRVTKPGGKVVIADLDAGGFNHYPIPDYLEQQIRELFKEFHRLRIWDPHMGRKIFSLFQEACLENVRVHVLPYHVVAGNPQRLDMSEWDERISRLEQLVDLGLSRLSFDLKSFKHELHSFFQNPMRFSYTNMILVEGTRPQ